MAATIAHLDFHTRATKLNVSGEKSTFGGRNKLFFAVCVIKNEIDFCGPGGDVVGSRMWAGPSALLKRKAEPLTDEDTGCPFEPS